MPEKSEQGVGNSGFETSTVIRPQNKEDVQHWVREARRQARALYPVSTGLNWGYGAAEPTRADCLLMDLSGMNRILNAGQISAANPVAVIEPGVTQGQLHLYLQENCPELSFNVTGSAAATSILGNSLDRGVGYQGPRREDIFGLEFVSGAGAILQTGFRRLGDESPLAHCHPYGLGPMLDGLLFQGNFGVVTSACFKLQLRPQREVAVSLQLRREEDLPMFIDRLAQLKRERIMSSVTHVGNGARSRASLEYGVSSYLGSHCGLTGEGLAAEVARALATVAPSEWTSLGGVAGTRRQVDAALMEVKARMKDLARVRVVDERKLSLGYRILHPLRFMPWARANAAAISAIRPLHGLAAGVPTDAAINNLLWRFGRTDLPAEKLDESNCGVLFISPALPMDGRFVADVVAGMKQVGDQFRHELYITLNIETELSLVAIVNLLFNRSDTLAAERAKTCAVALHRYIKSRGLEVYRARADMMADIVDEGSEYWQTIRRLKDVFDPDNIISPGRYNVAH